MNKPKPKTPKSAYYHPPSGEIIQETVELEALHRIALRHANELYPSDSSQEAGYWIGAYKGVMSILGEANKYVELTDQIEVDLQNLIKKYTGEFTQEEVIEIITETLT